MPDHHRGDVGDLYELLEVSPRASTEVIQAAYRVLVRTYHPDRNPSPDAAERIRELNAAYDLLSDPQRRARYNLESARAERFSRVSKPVALGRPSRSFPLSVAPRSQSLEERFPIVNGQVLMIMLLVAAVFMILLVFLWISVDAPDTAAPAGPRLEFTAS
jgi:curved DNA-binding protein CbpA